MRSLSERTNFNSFPPHPFAVSRFPICPIRPIRRMRPISLGQMAAFSIDDPQLASSRSLLLVIAGGPVVTALMTIGGFFWLWHLRRGRLEAAATSADWLATFLVLCAIRWLRCFGASPAHPQPKDEALLSAGFGWPPWLLPHLIASAALALVVVAIRLHPRGGRLVPFGCAFLGCCLGWFLWLKVFGPKILP
jgi:hypothetical protein